MPTDLSGPVGALLAALLGGGTGGAVLQYVGNRRKVGSDVNVATFATLKEMNGLLNEKNAETQASLDTERAARRALEDELATERRERRALEDRVAALERMIPKEET